MSEKKLLVRPRPFNDESLIGYVLRLTEYNGYTSPHNILNLLPSRNIYLSARGLVIKEFVGDFSQSFDELARLVQKDSETISQLKSLTFPDHGDHRVEMSLTQSLENEYPYKFCPSCLRKSAYHRKLWNCVLVTACPMHNCLLYKHCPGCNQPVSLNRQCLLLCKCGFDLRDAPALKVATREMRVARHISAAFNAKGKPALSSGHILFNYSLTEFCSIIYYFSKRFFRLLLNKPIHFSRISDHERLHEVVVCALKLFDDFPKYFVYFLHNAFSESDYVRGSGQHNYFSWFLPNYYRTLPPSCAAFLLKAFNENINDALSANRLTTMTKLIGTEQALDRTSEQFGFHYSYFSRLVKEGMISQSNNFRYDAELFIQTLGKLRSIKKTEDRCETENHLNYREIESLYPNANEEIYYFLKNFFLGKIRYCYEDFRLAGINRFFFDRKDIEKFFPLKANNM